MNIKKIEGKILDLSYKHDNEITLAVDDIIEIIRQAIKQVVESVPVEEEIKLFQLKREEDVSGISGIGIVADGCVFPDGMAVLRWRTAGGSTAVYDSVESVEKIHGHNGKTKIVYIQEIKQWRKKILKELKEEK